MFFLTADGPLQDCGCDVFKGPGRSGQYNERCSRLESTMNAVQVEQKSYEMPPREGISIAQFLTVADIERSARYYERFLALAF